MIFAISFIHIVLIFSVMTVLYCSIGQMVLGQIPLNKNSSVGSNQFSYQYDNSKSSLKLISTKDNNDKGKLMVKVITINNDFGKNKSSDFLVNIHANDPMPSIFKGNSIGTLVKLSMGMYSVTISSIPNYNASFSDDCSGGIMDVDTKFCNIINKYSIFSNISNIKISK